jgi:alkylation response protein AidB-like acyl-CoA dehydrogenase
MVEQFTNRQRTRKNAYTGAKGILNPAGYMRLAESVQELESLSAYYRQILEEMQEFGMRREKLTETSFMRLQTRIPFVSARAINVLNRLFEAAGASAIADFNVMQRFWRDAHAARLHQGMDLDVALQHFGRNLMGLPPTPDL